MDRLPRSYAYRPRLLPLGLAVAFFAGCGWILGASLPGLGAWAFVACGLAAGLWSWLRPQRVVLDADVLVVPAGRWSRAELELPRAAIRSVELQTVAGQRLLKVEHAGGTVTLVGSMFPSDGDLDAVVSWILGEPAPPPPPEPRRIGGLGLLGLKIGALLSFCGGPLVVTDLLKPSLGDPGAFAVGFAPIALMAFGTFAAVEDEPSPLTRIVVGLGALGSVVVLAETALAAWLLSTGEPRADAGLIGLGCLVGGVTSVLFLRMASGTLRG